MALSTPDRLSRLLGLVPYLTANPGARLDAVAARFGCTRAELIDDLQLLFVSGRPGHMPDDLIEASWEDDRIYVSNAEEVSVPVRLSRAEAGTLTLALEAIEALDPPDAEAVVSAKAKLAAAARLDDGQAPHFDVVLPEVDAEIAGAVRSALRGGEDLTISYYVPSRDELTERKVTPLSLRLAGRWYLEADCHLAGGKRSFALDNIRRIRSVSAAAAGSGTGPVDTAGQPEGHGQAARTGQAAGNAQNAAEAVEQGPEQAQSSSAARAAAPRPQRVRLSLDAAGSRLIEDLSLPTEYDTHGPGSATVTLTVYDPAWLTRWLLAHGRHVLALDPPDAARAAAQQAVQALETIRTPGSSRAG